MSVFDLPHIFVVFPPGAGGNFITGLIDKLMRSDTTAIDIANTGSSHTTAKKLDYISFGRFVSEKRKFQTHEDRINFYLSKIVDITEPQVVWTHDYDNIKIYKSLFKNSKILLITATTEQEQLSVTLMHVLKNLQGKDVVTPFSEEEWTRITTEWNKTTITHLSTLVPNSKLDTAISDNDLNMYINLKRFFRFYGMMEYKSVPILNIDSHLNPRPYDIDTVLIEECTTLPYSYLINNDISKLVSTLETLLSKKLSIMEKEYVENMFARYRIKQDHMMLTDPIKYYQLLTDKFNSRIEELNEN